jgi:hypothetical protein
MKILSIVTGFITNSSSVIHGFNAELLNDERVQAMLSAYGVEKGFIGDDLMNRGDCGSLLITPEQKEEASKQFRESEYGGIEMSFDRDSVYVIYGDEYDGLAQEISRLFETIAEEKGLPRTYGNSYN